MTGGREQTQNNEFPLGLQHVDSICASMTGATTGAFVTHC